MNESKYSRKYDFPESISEGFKQLEKLDLTRASQEKIVSIVDELIFSEFDRRSGRKRHLTPVKELQILEKIASYFWERKNDTQHLVFLWLFMPGKKLSQLRFSVLTKLLSLSIADANGNLLHYIASWMQMSGCHCETPCLLTDIMVKEYFTLVPKLTAHLDRLPAVSPLFCCGFLSCLTSIFRSVCPPPEILKLSLNWLVFSPNVCFASLGSNVSSHTPLPGLVHWCTFAPVHLKRQMMEASVEELISRLHLRILELIKGFGRGENCQIAVVYRETIADLLAESRLPGTDIQLPMDRLAQYLQVALSSGCLQDSSELFRSISSLPYNRLLGIIRERWK